MSETENEGMTFEGDDEEGTLTVNLSGINDEVKFEAIPRGTYPAEVDSVEFGHSQSSGNPMWTWKLRLTGGGEEDQYANRILFYHTVFNENGLPRVKRALNRLGQTELLENDFNPETVAEEGILEGLACQVKVDIQKYQGQKRNNVRDLLPPSEGDGGFVG